MKSESAIRRELGLLRRQLRATSYLEQPARFREIDMAIQALLWATDHQCPTPSERIGGKLAPPRDAGRHRKKEQLAQAKTSSFGGFKLCAGCGSALTTDEERQGNYCEACQSL